MTNKLVKVILLIIIILFTINFSKEEEIYNNGDIKLYEFSTIAVQEDDNKKVYVKYGDILKYKELQSKDFKTTDINKVQLVNKDDVMKSIKLINKDITIKPKILDSDLGIMVYDVTKIERLNKINYVLVILAIIMLMLSIINERTIKE